MPIIGDMKTIKVSKVHAGDVIPAMEQFPLVQFPVTVEYFYRMRSRKEVHIVGTDAKGTSVDLCVPSQSSVTIQ